MLTGRRGHKLIKGALTIYSTFSTLANIYIYIYIYIYIVFVNQYDGD
jgi:hypothetical protein